jgi:hypothetical protein
MTFMVDIHTRSDYLGHSRDHAVVHPTPALEDRIRTFHRALNELNADVLHQFDDSPDFHFVSPNTRIEVVRLVVARDGDFWWEGYLKHTDTAWQTGVIPLARLDDPADAVCDLRTSRAEDLDLAFEAGDPGEEGYGGPRADREAP